jgi:hypothetical protein
MIHAFADFYGYGSGYYTSSSEARFSQQVTIHGRPIGTSGFIHLYCEDNLSSAITKSPCEDPPPFQDKPDMDLAFQFGIPFVIEASMIGSNAGSNFIVYGGMEVFDESRQLLHTFGCKNCSNSFMQQSAEATYVIPGDPTAVPEPATVMTGVAVAALAFRRRLTA